MFALSKLYLRANLLGFALFIVHSKAFVSQQAPVSLLLRHLVLSLNALGVLPRDNVREGLRLRVLVVVKLAGDGPLANGRRSSRLLY